MKCKWWFWKDDFVEPSPCGAVCVECASFPLECGGCRKIKEMCIRDSGYHRVGGGCFPVGADVGGGIEELGCNLVQHLSFERNTFRQYYVEG